VGVTVEDDGSLTPFPGLQINLTPAYGAGFALAIVAFLAFAAAAVLVALFPKEASRAPVDAAATAAALAVDTLGAVVYPSVAVIAPPGGGTSGAYANDDGVARQQVYAPEGAPAFPPSTPPPHQALPYQLPQQQGGGGGATVSPNPLQRLVAPAPWGAGASDGTGAAAAHLSSSQDHAHAHHTRAAFPPQPESALSHAGGTHVDAGAVPPAVPPRSRPPPVPAAAASSSFATVGSSGGAVPPATPQRQLHVSYVPQSTAAAGSSSNGLDDGDAGAMPPPAPTYDAAGGDGHQPTI
jgi:hypothetical protein